MIERKTAPRWRLALALLVAVSVFAAACGGDDDDDAGSPSTGGGATSAPSSETSVGGGAEDMDPNGVLRVAGSILSQGVATTQFDPTKMISPAVIPQMLVYDTLLRANLDGTYEPALATSAEIVDPSTIKIELREGVTFSDGTPFDAEAVKAGIQRNVDAQNPGAFAAELDEVESITVDGPLSLTIKLKSPIAGHFYALLSRGETMIVSPKAVADGVDLMTNPVGAGPYLLDSIEIESKMTLVKNPNYWDADNIRVPTIEYIHVQGPEAITNALRAGTVDFADMLTPDIVRALQGSDVTVESSISENTWFWGQLCKRDAPFDDVRVRQAMNYALDRDQLNNTLYEGQAEPMWGAFSADSKFHNPELTGYYERDVDKAKELLAEAGYADGIDVEIVVPSTGGLSSTAAELIQAQWAEAGIRVKLTQSSNLVQEFFVENKYPLYFFQLQRMGIDRVTRNLVPGSIGNICQWDHAELNEVVKQLQAVDPNSDEAVELWHEIEELMITEAMNIFGLFGMVANAYNADRIGDVEFRANFQGVPHLDVTRAYVKKA